MKKYEGFCPRCGVTVVGLKRTGFSGGRIKGKGFYAHKKGTVKCLSCQSVIGVKKSD